MTPSLMSQSQHYADDSIKASMDINSATCQIRQYCAVIASENRDGLREDVDLHFHLVQWASLLLDVAHKIIEGGEVRLVCYLN